VTNNEPNIKTSPSREENKVKTDLNKGSFVSIRVTEDERLRLMRITSKCKEIGLNVGVSTIVRKIYNEGLKTLDLEEARRNPLSLFIDKSEES
jgi:hypothetical protein